MSARYIQYVTLSTGHARRTARSEVSDHVVAQMRPLLVRALAGEYAPLPGIARGYTMRGARYGRCCTVTLYAPASESARPRLVPMLTIGVAEHSRCGARLWRYLHETATGLVPVTSPDRTPPEPWVADRIEIGAALHVDAMHWTGDWSHCVAWTWLEMLGRSDDGAADGEDRPDAAAVDPDR